MAASTLTYIAAASLAYGLKSGVSQSAARGDSGGVKAGLLTGNAKNALNVPTPLSPIKRPQLLPTINSDAVQKARSNALTSLQSRSGRASTLLTTSNTFG